MSLLNVFKSTDESLEKSQKISLSITAKRMKYLKEEHWKCRSELQDQPEKCVSHFFGMREMSWMHDYALELNRPSSPDPRIRRMWINHISDASVEDFGLLQDDSYIFSNVSSCATTVTENIPSANFDSLATRRSEMAEVI